ncbi:hypothetical protein AMECASPLE_033512 [Ameca splendens]|uniref:Uncharacterized protein n=1 Tax=Ameca splendens TaxID=208324 RepID=A0ABV0YTX9_9TELE
MVTVRVSDVQISETETEEESGGLVLKRNSTVIWCGFHKEDVQQNEKTCSKKKEYQVFIPPPEQSSPAKCRILLNSACQCLPTLQISKPAVRQVTLFLFAKAIP